MKVPREVWKEYIERNDIKPMDWEAVRVKFTGHVTEFMWVEHLNRMCHVRKLDADHYMLLDGDCAGEVKEYDHGECRTDNRAYLRRTLAYVRDLINCNVIRPERNKWVTLTYRGLVRDTKKLYSDFKNWIQLVRYHYPGMEYVAVAEPQGRGAWHMHVLMVWPGPAPYIPQKDMRAWWEKQGGGSVYVKAVDSGGDNLGAYLSAYLGDAEIKPGEKLPDGAVVKEVTTEDGKTKRYVKGSRLKYYPAGMQIVRASRGVLKPNTVWMPYEKAKKIVGAATLTNEKKYPVEDPKTGYKNHVYYAYYNSRRGKAQSGT